jgi:hypothetical protein
MMLTTEYPQALDNWTLSAACEELKGDPATDIPFLMWLLENPDSPFALPGNIGLYNHDCMHLILKQGFSSENEAYVVGFSMGNDVRTKWLHQWAIKISSVWLYPKKYRWQQSNVAAFDRGLKVGKATNPKNLNQSIPESWHHKTLPEIRAELGLSIE